MFLRDALQAAGGGAAGEVPIAYRPCGQPMPVWPSARSCQKPAGTVQVPIVVKFRQTVHDAQQRRPPRRLSGPRPARHGGRPSPRRPSNSRTIGPSEDDFDQSWNVLRADAHFHDIVKALLGPSRFGATSSKSRSRRRGRSYGHGFSKDTTVIDSPVNTVFVSVPVSIAGQDPGWCGPGRSPAAPSMPDGSKRSLRPAFPVPAIKRPSCSAFPKLCRRDLPAATVSMDSRPHRLVPSEKPLASAADCGTVRQMRNADMA